MHTNLLLDRYEFIKTIKKTQTKNILLYNNRENGQRIVSKQQHSNILNDLTVRNILHEAAFTQNLQGYRGIPKIFWSGKTWDNRIVMVVEELGESLRQKLEMCEGKFSVKSTCMLGTSIINIVKTIHDKGYILSNVSLDLFQFGKGSKSQQLYVNDLGDCLMFRNQKTLVHIMASKLFRNPKHLFQSGAVYQNIEKSRRDDIESVILILIYVLKGDLSWSSGFQNNCPPSPEFITKFNDSKQTCEGCPAVLLQLLEDCRSLKFEDEPEYHWYLLRLKSWLDSEGEDDDNVYDWMLCDEYVKQVTVKRRNPNIKLTSDQILFKLLEAQTFSEQEDNKNQGSQVHQLESKKKIKQPKSQKKQHKQQSPDKKNKESKLSKSMVVRKNGKSGDCVLM